MHKRLKKKTTEIFSATKTLQHLCTAHTQSEDPITIVHHRKTVCVYNIKRWRYGGNIWIIHFAIVDATCYLYVLYSNIYKNCAFNVIRSYICRKYSRVFNVYKLKDMRKRSICSIICIPFIYYTLCMGA